MTWNKYEDTSNLVSFDERYTPISEAPQPEVAAAPKPQTNNNVGNTDSTVVTDDAKKAEAEQKAKTHAQQWLEENPRPGLDKKDQEKEAKRRRWRELIAAIGDGVGAIAGMAYGKGGTLPTKYNLTNLSDKLREHWKTIDAEREKNLREWQAAYQRAQSMDMMQNSRNATAEAQGVRAKAYADDKQNQTEVRTSRAEVQNAKDQSVIDLNEKRGGLVTAQTVTEQGKPAVQQSQIEKNEKTGDAAVIRAGKTGSRGSSGGKGDKSALYDEFEAAVAENPADWLMIRENVLRTPVRGRGGRVIDVTYKTPTEVQMRQFIAQTKRKRNRRPAAHSSQQQPKKKNRLGL